MAGTGIAIGAAAISSVAFAAWTTDATGSVSDKAGSVQNLTIVAAPDPKADLFPGKTGAAQFTITNPNPFDVTITSITIDTVTTSAAECAASNLTPVKKTIETTIAVKANSTTATHGPAGPVMSCPTLPGGTPETDRNRARTLQWPVDQDRP